MLYTIFYTLYTLHIIYYTHYTTTTYHSIFYIYYTKYTLADWLRRHCKIPLYVAVNKCESEKTGKTNDADNG